MNALSRGSRTQNERFVCVLVELAGRHVDHTLEPGLAAIAEELERLRQLAASD
jgi:hypothetical protein